MRGRVDAIVIGAAIVTVSGAVALALWARLNASWPVAALAAATTAVALLILAVRQRRPSPRPAAAQVPAGNGGAEPPRAPTADAIPPAAAAAIDTDLHRRIESIENGLRAVARRCFELDQRMEALDRQSEQRGHDTVKAVAAELSVIGTVVRDLAEAVALHDAELFSGDDAARRRAAARGEVPEVAPPGERIVPNAPAARSTTLTIAEVAPSAPAASPPAQDTPAPAPPTAPAAAAPQERTPPPAKPQEAGASQTVRRALVSGGVDLFLHSVVSLPQRKVRLYEALGRVREPDGGFAESDAVAAAAAKLGLTAKLETDLFRSVCKVASHLAARERDVPVMCPVSLPTLREPAYFAALAEAAERDRQVPVRVVLRLRQPEIARIGVIEAEAMEAARGLGFRFALDGVDDLRLDARDLAGRGVRYVKVPARLLLAAGAGDAPTEIHPADLSDLLARHGLSLIASGVDSEATAVEIQDFSPPLAQGPLFSGPRPVRGEVLTADPPVRAGAAEAQPTAPAPVAPSAPPAPTGAAASGPGAAAADAAAAAGKPERLPLRAFLRRTTG